MYWQTKIAWSEVLVIAAIAKVRQEEGDTFADAFTITGAIIAVGAIWYPEIRASLVGAALATPLAPAAAIAASAYALGGLISYTAAPEGKEAEALVEYYHDPLGTTKDIIIKEVKETAHQIESLVTGTARSAAREIERRYDEKKDQVKSAWSWVENNWRWSNPTPGLSF